MTMQPLGTQPGDGFTEAGVPYMSLVETRTFPDGVVLTRY